MQDVVWKESEKCPCVNHRRIESSANRGFAHATFDLGDEVLFPVDLGGSLHAVELSQENFPHRKLGHVGACAFVALDPVNKNLIFGLESGEIRVSRPDDFTDHCVLSGHTSLPRHASFYKNFCLTVSDKEAIIWNLRSYSKAHRLQLRSQNVAVRKAAFSSLGLIAVLYKNDSMQAWTFQRFDKDVKIDLKEFGVRHVKDFTFTGDGKAAIIGGSECRVVVFNTLNWQLIKHLKLGINLPGITEIAALPRALDGGANKTVAVLLSDSTLRFFNLQTEEFVEDCGCGEMNLVKRILVSRDGRFLVNLMRDGSLVVSWLDKMLREKISEKTPRERRVHAHRAEDHLLCVQQAMKEELKIERLMPILKEFGEYPEKHRALIWSTIMKLPSNRRAYVSLSNKCPEDSVVELFSKCSLADKGKANLLKTTVACLVRWTTLFGDCSFLPGLAFPFVVVFQKNPMLAFEAVLTIVLNFCQNWWEYHPLPPLNILGIVENVLLESDPALLRIFEERGATSTDYAWPLLCTSFSEVLPDDEWLILWDHLLSYGKPSLFVLCAVAYSICSREAIISTLKSTEDFQRFYSHQGHVGAKSLLRVAHRLDRETSRRIHPSLYIRNYVETLPTSDVYPPFPQKEYPKILAEDEQVQNLKKLKEREQILQSRHRKAAKLAEEQRLRTESENFIKRVQRDRMEELRKCYEERICDQAWSLDRVREGAIWDSTEEHKSLHRRNRNVADDESDTDSEILDEHFRFRRKSNDKVRDEMRDNVEHLEYEVYNLLSNLRSKDSKTRRY